MYKFLAVSLLLPAFMSASELDGNDLVWLVGCWVSIDKDSHEVSVAESADRMVGFGVAVNDDTLGFYEVLTLSRGEDGAWVYTAHPAGQAATSFVASDVTDQHAVFVNPAHDYPQEIRYRTDGNTLHATISLSGGANPTSLTKAACGAD